MRRILPLLASVILLLTGCFSMEIGLDLDRDHSGTASFDITMDMEPIAYMMASMSKMFSRGGGPPTEAEIEEAKQGLLDQKQKQQEVFDLEEARAEMEADLPEGIELVDVQHRSDGLKEGYTMTFSFQHLDQLKQLDLDTPDPSVAGAGRPSELEKRLKGPYSGFTLTDEGSTWRLGNEPMNPLEAAKKDMQMGGIMQMGGMEWMEEMVNRIFQGMKMTFRITVPTEVVDHNATRVEGRTLYWELSYEEFQNTSPVLQEGIFVRYRK